MERNIYLSDYVFCTLKKQSREIVKELFISAALNGYNIMRFGDGFIASYDFAKKNLKKMRLHCSRFFSENDLADMRQNNLISQERFDSLTGKN